MWAGFSIIIILVFCYIRHSHATECGLRPKDAEKASDKRITGGHESVPGGWPWMAAIFVQESSKYFEFQCGATLVSERWVVSAGHCGVTSIAGISFTELDPSQITVLLGVHRAYGDPNVKKESEQELSVKRIIYDPMWAIHSENTTEGRKMIMVDDMMLLELEKPVKLSKVVQPICLRKEAFKPGTMCYVAGWGTEKIRGPILGTLHEAAVPIVSREKCNKRKSYTGMITKELICAGYLKGGKDTCEGDSGGPLMCEGDDKKWYIAGVASFGHDGCGIPHKYGVYASTASNRQWIENSTKINFF